VNRSLAAFGVVVAICVVQMGRAPAQTAAPNMLSELHWQHPAGYYWAAARLFGEGKKDEAVFAYHLGELRFRAHLMARENLPDQHGILRQDRQLMGIFASIVGGPINEYARGDIPALVRVVEAVLAYGRAYPNTYTSPEEFPLAYSKARDLLVELKTMSDTRADELRVERRKRGLENRT